MAAPLTTNTHVIVAVAMVLMVMVITLATIIMATTAHEDECANEHTDDIDGSGIGGKACNVCSTADTDNSGTEVIGGTGGRDEIT